MRCTTSPNAYSRAIRCEVAIHANGSYAYSYDGVLIFVPALTQVAHAGFCACCEDNSENLPRNCGKKDFERLSISGGGRYAVIFEGARAKGEPLTFLSGETPVFSITPQRDGEVRSEPSIRTQFHNANPQIPAQR